MGNIDVSVQKNVDFNKFVTKDIFKDVTTNVNLNGDLAEAEADAEAFGTSDYYALAETDTFAIVNRTNGMQMTEDVVVDVDALGNSVTFGQDGIGETVTEPITGNTYELPQNITIDFEENADIDDLNWTGGLDGNDTIPGADTPLPTEGFVANDKDLIYVEDQTLPIPEVQDDGSVVIVAEYELAEPWVVDFSPPDRTITGEVKTDTDSLSIVIPEDTLYLVEFLDEDGDGTIDAKELEFEAFPANQRGQWVFGEESFDIDVYTQIADEIIATGLSDWAFEALGTITINGHSGGGVEAFAYSESTAALDLISGADVVI